MLLWLYVMPKCQSEITASMEDDPLPVPKSLTL